MGLSVGSGGGETGRISAAPSPIGFALCLSGAQGIVLSRKTLTKFALIAALAAAGAGSFAAPSFASEQLRGPVASSYTYGLSWSPSDRRLSGIGTVAVSNVGGAATRDVWLRLRPNTGRRIARIGGLSGARIAATRAAGSMVLLRLPAELKSGDSTRIRFRFALEVPLDDTSLGRSLGVDLFGDALPVVAVGGPRGLRIGAEPSYGEGSFNPVADWRISLRVPRGLRVVLPGDLQVSRRARSTIYRSTARVRDGAFAIGHLIELTRRVDGVRITVAGSSRKELPTALRRAAHAFATLQRWYGGYHLPTLTVVIGDLDFGGSEYPGVVFSTPDNATIAHEVAHQWFYGLVGNDQYNDPWLDESLTAFAEQRFHRSYRCDLANPLDGSTHGLGTGMDYWQRHPTGYEHTIYRGGVCALTVLRRDLGTAVFDRALRAYVAENADKIAGTDDFLAAIRNTAPWYDLARWERLVGLT
jgi:hypothetical protein